MSSLAVFIATFTLACAIANVIRRWGKSTSHVRKKLDPEYEAAKRAPGPFSWPIVGNAPSLGEAPHLTFDAMTKKYGPLFQIKIGTVPVVVINDIPTIKAALSKQKEIFSGRPQFASYKLVSLGLGAVFNDVSTIGADWRNRKNKMLRHIHNYAMSNDSRQSTAEHIWNEIEYMTTALEQQCLESPTGFVDPEQVMRVSVGNAVCAMCFGKRYRVDNAVSALILV